MAAQTCLILCHLIHPELLKKKKSKIKREGISKRGDVEGLFSPEGKALRPKHRIASTSKEIVCGSVGGEGERMS